MDRLLLVNIRNEIETLDGIADDLKEVIIANDLSLPGLADGITLTGGAGAWAQGVWAEVDAAVAANVVLTGLMVEAVTGIHEIQIGTGAAAAEVGLCSMKVPAVGYYPLRSTRIPSATRIAARTASKAGGAQTCIVHLQARVVT